MYRAIYSQALYQFIVLAIILYSPGVWISDENDEYNMITTRLLDDGGYPTRKMKHFTMLFHTFVIMNVLNQFNCRNIGGDPAVIAVTYNVFKYIFSNWWFLIVVLGELNFQYAIVSYPGLNSIFGCT